jgi:hypothetical protein
MVPLQSLPRGFYLTPELSPTIRTPGFYKVFLTGCAISNLIKDIHPDEAGEYRLDFVGIISQRTNTIFALITGGVAKM